jgi:hypothetical protein
MNFSGINPRTGRLYVYNESIAGGLGARAARDGLDGAQAHITNTSNLPVEALEPEHPLVVESYELVRDSGGAGRTRGGMALRRQIRVVGHDARVIVWGACITHAALGPVRRRPGGTSRTERSAGVAALAKGRGVVPAGESVALVTAGAGGYGDPQARERALVRRDLAEDRISAQAARDLYGLDPAVLITGDCHETDAAGDRTAAARDAGPPRGAARIVWPGALSAGGRARGMRRPCPHLARGACRPIRQSAPWEYVGTAAETVKLQLFRGLLRLRPGRQPAARARRAHRAEGDRAYVVTLRPNARFHNGDPVTAATSSSPSKPSSPSARPPICGASSRSSSASRLRTRRRCASSCASPMPCSRACWPATTRRSCRAARCADPAAPVGAGALRDSRSERGRASSSRRSPASIGPGLPRTRNLAFLAYADENLRTRRARIGRPRSHRVRAGGAHGRHRAQSPARRSIGRRAVHDPDLQRAPGPFQNRLLRQAVAFAINRAEIVRAGFAGRGSPAGGLAIPPSSPFYDAENGQFWRHDPGRVRPLS